MCFFLSEKLLMGQIARSKVQNKLKKENQRRKSYDLNLKFQLKRRASDLIQTRILSLA